MNDDAEQALKEIQRKARAAAVAEIGGFRPPDDPRCSWFGGAGVGKPGEELPIYRGTQMFPLLQINVKELPVVPSALAGVELIMLFMNRDEIPFEKPHGDGWLIREYTSLEGLVPLPTALGPSLVRPFPIRWRREEGETPGWEDAWDVVDLSAVNNDEEASGQFFETMKNHSGTKVGGYPTEIQHGVGIEDFVFQVGSEEKPRWMWADNGIGYFFKNQSGQWRFACQLY